MTDELTPGQEALADDAATAIVNAARALHPGDPVKQAACALNAAMHLTAIWPGTVTHNESLTLSPAELEQRLASPGAKFDREVG